MHMHPHLQQLVLVTRYLHPANNTLLIDLEVVLCDSCMEYTTHTNLVVMATGDGYVEQMLPRNYIGCGRKNIHSEWTGQPFGQRLYTISPDAQAHISLAVSNGRDS